MELGGFGDGKVMVVMKVDGREARWVDVDGGVSCRKDGGSGWGEVFVGADAGG